MADAYVVDTGVFLRWYVPQDGFEHAREVQQRFVNGLIRLETVDFVRIELAEVLRKKGLLTRLLDRGLFVAATRHIDELGVLVHAADVDRLTRAAGLAIDHSLRMYDAIIVQVAIDQDIPLLTTDAKLCKAVAGLLPTELLRGAVPTDAAGPSLDDAQTTQTPEG